MEPVIEIKNLHAEYRVGREKTVALKGINLRAYKGEIFGFIGPNGAGKTTTINVLLGFMRPTNGEAIILDEKSSSLKNRFRIGYLPETAYYYPYLTPSKILTMYGKLFRIDKITLNSRIDSVLAIVGLMGKKNTPIRNLSKGMQQRLGLAQAIINDPDVMILDEPNSGLDPIGKREMRDIILELRNKGKTIFFSSHELSEVELICDRVGIIDRGQILKTEKLDQIVGKINTKNQDKSGSGRASLEDIFVRTIKDKRA